MLVEMAFNCQLRFRQRRIAAILGTPSEADHIWVGQSELASRMTARLDGRSGDDEQIGLGSRTISDTPIVADALS